MRAIAQSVSCPLQLSPFQGATNSSNFKGALCKGTRSQRKTESRKKGDGVICRPQERLLCGLAAIVAAKLLKREKQKENETVAMTTTN